MSTGTNTKKGSPRWGPFPILEPELCRLGGPVRLILSGLIHSEIDHVVRLAVIFQLDAPIEPLVPLDVAILPRHVRGPFLDGKSLRHRYLFPANGPRRSLIPRDCRSLARNLACSMPR